jgi:hypothetical protein
MFIFLRHGRSLFVRTGLAAVVAHAGAHRPKPGVFKRIFSRGHNQRKKEKKQKIERSGMISRKDKMPRKEKLKNASLCGEFKCWHALV